MRDLVVDNSALKFKFYYYLILQWFKIGWKTGTYHEEVGSENRFKKNTSTYMAIELSYEQHISEWLRFKYSFLYILGHNG